MRARLQCEGSSKLWERLRRCRTTASVKIYSEADIDVGNPTNLHTTFFAMASIEDSLKSLRTLRCEPLLR